jgi:hypothetical protein
VNPAVQFTATRSLYLVTAGTVVNYSLPVRYAGMERSKATFGTTRRSLSGARETYYESTEYSYAISTIPLSDAKRLQLRMFLDSVEQGESFLFSHDGAATMETAYLEPRDYSESRIEQNDKLVVVSFNIVVP